MLKKVSFLLISGTLLLVASCHTTKKAADPNPTVFDADKVYVPSAKHAGAVSLADLEKGYTIYKKSCDRCHKFYPVTKYNVEEWTAIVKKMQPKAKLSDGDAALVTKYLTAYK